MNAIGISLVWATMQISVIGIVTVVLYLATRRFGPRLAVTTVFSGLTCMALTLVLAFCPLPAWSISVPLINPSDARPTVRVANENSPDSGKPFDADIPHWTMLAKQLWLEEIADASVPNPRTVDTGSDSKQQVAEVRRRWRWTGLLALVSIAATSYGAMRVAGGLFAARRYGRSSRELHDRVPTEILDILKARLGCRAHVRLHEHPSLTSAATIGWWRPIIMLPRRWQTWPTNDLEAVVAHELAHIHHRDFLGWVCAQVFVAVQFFHPLAHWLASRLRLEQELAADAVAAEIAGGRTRYLTSLAELALHQDDARLSWSAQAFLPTRRSFLRRIEMLRNKRHGSDVGQRRLRPVVVSTLLAVGVIIVGWRQPELVSVATPALAAQPVRSAAPANDAPVDLKFVPRDALLVAAIRPSRLLARDEFSEMTKLFKDDLSDDPSRLDFESVDALRVVLLPTNEGGRMEPDGIGFMLRFNKANDYIRDAFTTDAGEFAGHAIMKNHSEYAAQIDDRTLLTANDLPILRRMLAAGDNEPNREQWVGEWRANAKKDGLAAVNISRLKPILESIKDRNDDGRDPFLNSLDVLGSIWSESKHAVVSLSLEEPMNGQIELTANNEKAAASSIETAKALVTLGRNMLSGVRDSASRNGGDLAVTALQFADLGESMLDTTKFSRDQEIVSADFELDSTVVRSAVTFLVPATTAARSAARRAQDMNSIRQIMLGLLNYESAHGHFPAARMLGPDGKTVHSWRVAILPYLEQNSVYDQYRQDEPWDSPHNIKLLDQMPAVYRSALTPRDSTNASFFVFTGPDAAFDGTTKRRLRDIRDGTSKTLFLIDAKRDIPWTKPEDIPFDMTRELPDLTGHRAAGNIVGFGDGSVRFLAKDLDREVLKRLITIQGGEPINF